MKSILSTITVLFFYLATCAQNTGFVEVIVTDTIYPKAIGYDFEVGIGEEKNMWSYLEQDKDVPDEPITPQMLEKQLKDRKYNYRPAHNHKLPDTDLPRYVVSLKTMEEVEALTKELENMPGATGSLIAIHFEPVDAYLKQSSAKLFARARASALEMALSAGGSVGNVISIQETSSDADSMTSWYRQMLKMMPREMFGDGATDDGAVVRRFAYRFALN
jgi:hypothetical protein